MPDGAGPSMLPSRAMRFIGFSLAVAFLGCAHAPPQPADRRAAALALSHREGAPIPPARPADVESADAILHAVYDTISGPPGPRDWNRFRSLFVPGARLIPAASGPPGSAGASEVRALVLDVEGYVTLGGPILEKEGFFEREAARRTEQFGDIEHAFSTYESRHAAADPQPFERGINSFQLLQSGGRWWIVTIYWQGETPERPIPSQYLQ